MRIDVLDKKRPIRTVVLSSILAFLCCSYCQAQTPRSEVGDVALNFSDVELDISPNGQNVRTCAQVWGDGRFHIEQRIQQLPTPAATLKTLDSSLDSSQLRRLQDIIANESLAELPPFRWPTGVDLIKFHAFRVNFKLGSRVRDLGYMTPQKMFPPKLADTSLEGEWERSEAALQPLVEWFRSLERSSILSASGAEATLCSSEMH